MKDGSKGAGQALTNMDADQRSSVVESLTVVTPNETTRMIAFLASVKAAGGAVSDHSDLACAYPHELRQAIVQGYLVDPPSAWDWDYHLTLLGRRFLGEVDAFKPIDAFLDRWLGRRQEQVRRIVQRLRSGHGHAR